MRKLFFLAPLVAFAALVGWLAVPLIRGSDPSQLPSVLVDQPAPATSLPGLPGRPGRPAGGLQADMFKGEVTLLNFFASWCVPCLAEHPVLTGLAEDQGITINAIAYKDAEADTVKWLARHGDPFSAIGVDADGLAGIDWGLTGVPETFIIDAEGRVRYRHIGPLSPATVREVLLPVIEQVRQ